MQDLFDYILHHIVKVSGGLFILGLIFIAFATGQAEISYTFAALGLITNLAAVIVSRFEGRSSAWREAKAFHEAEPGKDT